MTLRNTGITCIAPAGRLKTLREVNERSRQFWLAQSVRIERWMSDEAVLWSTIHNLEAQQLLRKAPGDQISFEKALADADERIYGVGRLFKQFRTNQSKKGGAATKTDGLRRLILEIVRKNRNITTPQLLDWLERHKEGTVVFEIDAATGLAEEKKRAIHFTERGTEKSSPISGLKDRLSRAKRTIAKEEITSR